MSRTATPNPAFDPEFCPLLRNLSPEERKLRIEQDPVIRNCVQALATNEGPGKVCRAAYEKQRARAAGASAGPSDDATESSLCS
jgi:hypothetical protein